MGKCVAYVAAAVVFTGLGALIAGIAVWYAVPEVAAKLSSEARRAQCVLQSSTGVTGTIVFDQRSEGAAVYVSGDISSITPGLHGFHIHAFGVSGANCAEAQGHYNPHGASHASPNDTVRHIGDLGNILASEIGVADINIHDSVITLWGRYSIMGRAVVVHEGEDDLGRGGNDGSLSTGNAGGRVACCNIYAVPYES